MWTEITRRDYERRGGRYRSRYPARRYRRHNFSFGEELAAGFNSAVISSPLHACIIGYVVSMGGNLLKGLIHFRFIGKFKSHQPRVLAGLDYGIAF